MQQDIRDVDQGKPVVTQELLDEAMEFLKGIVGLTPQPLGDDHRNWNLGAFAGYLTAFGIEPITTLHEQETVFSAHPINYRAAKVKAIQKGWTGDRLREHLYACGVLYGYKKGIVECHDYAECTECDNGLRSDWDEVITCECGVFCNAPNSSCFDDFDHSNACKREFADTGWEKP